MGMLEEMRPLLQEKLHPLCNDCEVKTSSAYTGPIFNTNWVIPGMLLVGGYPVANTRKETTALLTTLLKQGINTFVNLAEEYAELGPYFDEVRAIVRTSDTGTYEAQAESGYIDVDVDTGTHSIAKEGELTFVHFPIFDSRVVEDSRTLTLALNLVKAIQRGERVYMHCKKGDGRTGTVVSVMLHLMYGLTAQEAMERCQLLHDQRESVRRMGAERQVVTLSLSLSQIPTLTLTLILTLILALNPFDRYCHRRQHCSECR